MQQVSESYLDGIREGREIFEREGVSMARERLATLVTLCRQFDSSNPVGQLFRGERDFWKNKLKGE